MPLITSRDLIGEVVVRYHNRLRVELQDTDRRVSMLLLEPLVVDVFIPSLGISQRLTVPAGFRTNLASTPRPLWWIPGFAPFGRIERIAALHDWLYSIRCNLPWVTQPVSDAILDAGLRADGECWLVRELVWFFVRLYGESHWRKEA